MASNVLVELEYAPLKKTAIKTTPAMTMKTILSSACQKLNLDENKYRLKHQKTILELSLSVRFANLPAGAKLVLVKVAESVDAGPQVVTVALQLEDGKRLIDKFPSNTKLWDVLLNFETNELNLTRRVGVPNTDKSNNATNFFKNLAELAKPKQPVYMIPVLILMSKEFNTIQSLKSSSLADAGLVSGNSVIKLLFRYTDQTLEQVLPQIDSKLTFPKRSTSLAEEDVKMDVEVKPVDQVYEKELAIIDVEKQTNEPIKVDESRHSDEKDTVMESATNETPLKDSVTVSPPEESKAVVSSEPESLSSVRDIHYFRPPPPNAESAANIELPESFYELTAAELKMLVQSQKYNRDLQENKPLLTKALRERQEEMKRAKWPKTLIRVRFPDRVTLQATFYSHENVSELYKVVRSSLENPPQFQLFVTPPQRTLLESQNFWTAGLAPQSVVYIRFSESHAVGLKSELVEKLEDFPVPTVDVPMDGVMMGTEKLGAITDAVLKAGHRLDEPSTKPSSEGHNNKQDKPNSKDLNKTPAWFKMGKK